MLKSKSYRPFVSIILHLKDKTMNFRNISSNKTERNTFQGQYTKKKKI